MLTRGDVSASKWFAWYNSEFEPIWLTNLMNNQNLQGRNALITGASKGLGRAMAVALGAQGAHLILVARDKEKLESVAEEVRTAGGTASVFAADITQEDQVLALEAEVSSKVGKVQILVN